jgi:hypothetical protein
LSGKSGKSDKSSKSAKQPKSVCLERGFKIEPDFEGIASPQIIYLDCCQGWTGYDQTTPWTGTAATDLAALIGCSDELAESENFQECSEKYRVTYPFVHAAYGYDNEFEFATISDAPLGETAFRGAIGTDTGNEKIFLQYESTPLFDEDENSLAGRSLADLEYIEYSFKALACHGTVTECPEQFYLNVYSKADPPTSGGWYDCAFDFTPTEGGVENGDWTTIRFTRDSVPVRNRCGSGLPNLACNHCPAGTTWGAVADLDVGYEMGASTNQILIFALNMGDTSADDDGLEGLYDRVVVKLYGEEPRVYDL